MKLRIQGNSIRYRLTRTEVERLATDGRVTESVDFPGGRRMEYEVTATSGASAPQAEFRGDAIIVSVPRRVVADWAGSEEVTISGEQPMASGAALRILVEKDFACLSPREGEDESDMFPHPLEGKESC